MPHQARVALLVEDYSGERVRQTTPNWRARMATSITQLKKRLGEGTLRQLQAALEEDRFDAVAEALITYYDKLYDKHINNKTGQGNGTGTRKGKVVELTLENEVTLPSSSLETTQGTTIVSNDPQENANLLAGKVSDAAADWLRRKTRRQQRELRQYHRLKKRRLFSRFFGAGLCGAFVAFFVYKFTPLGDYLQIHKTYRHHFPTGTFANIKPMQTENKPWDTGKGRTRK
jgi:hypothetical protein